jgi:hypothetical protein
MLWDGQKSEPGRGACRRGLGVVLAIGATYPFRPSWNLLPISHQDLPRPGWLALGRGLFSAVEAAAGGTRAGEIRGCSSPKVTSQWRC